MSLSSSFLFSSGEWIQLLGSFFFYYTGVLRSCFLSSILNRAVHVVSSFLCVKVVVVVLVCASYFPFVLLFHIVSVLFSPSAVCGFLMFYACKIRSVPCVPSSCLSWFLVLTFILSPRFLVSLYFPLSVYLVFFHVFIFCVSWFLLPVSCFLQMYWCLLIVIVGFLVLTLILVPGARFS